MIRKIFENELWKGSLIFLILINIVNVLNFLFRFVTARLLGPAEYGTLAVIISFTLILSVSNEAIQNLFSKKTSEIKGEKEYLGKIKYLIKKSLRKSTKIAAILFVLLVIVSIILSEIFKIKLFLFAIASLLIFHAFYSSVLKGILQGEKKFFDLGIVSIFESLLKLILATLFVLLGAGIIGAVGGMVLGIFLSVLILFYISRKRFKEREVKVKLNKIYTQSTPYFIITIVTLLMLNIDIFLARIYFNPEMMGLYAVLSDMGKILFFATVAIGNVMFPLTSEKNNKKPRKDFFKALSLMFFMGLLGVIFFSLFPEQIVQILFGEEYISIAQYIMYSGIALVFMGLTKLTLLYGLSRDKMRNPYKFFLIPFVAILILKIFHGSILQYSLAFMFSNIIMFILGLFLIKLK